MGGARQMGSSNQEERDSSSLRGGRENRIKQKGGSPLLICWRGGRISSTFMNYWGSGFSLSERKGGSNCSLERKKELVGCRLRGTYSVKGGEKEVQ